VSVWYADLVGVEGWSWEGVGGKVVVERKGKSCT
jgi:hypothetical protein